jgi:GNAT superfamily N-acetyltransferase
MDALGLEIERVTEADASLVELINLAYRCPPGTGSAWTFEGDLIEGDRISAAGLQREWARGGTTLVAREGGKAVGTVTVWRDDTEVATVGLLAVLPTLQGRGLGARLLAAAERTAAELGGEAPLAVAAALSPRAGRLLFAAWLCAAAGPLGALSRRAGLWRPAPRGVRAVRRRGALCVHGEEPAVKQCEGKAPPAPDAARALSCAPGKCCRGRNRTDECHHAFVFQRDVR